MLEALSAAGTVLPMRFGMVAPCTTSLVLTELEANRPRYRRLLSQLAGGVELNVKAVHRVQDAVLSELLQRDRALRERNRALRVRGGGSTRTGWSSARRSLRRWRSDERSGRRCRRRRPSALRVPGQLRPSRRRFVRQRLVPRRRRRPNSVRRLDVRTQAGAVRGCRREQLRTVAAVQLCRRRRDCCLSCDDRAHDVVAARVRRR